MFDYSEKKWRSAQWQHIQRDKWEIQNPFVKKTPQDTSHWIGKATVYKLVMGYEYGSTIAEGCEKVKDISTIPFTILIITLITVSASTIDPHQ